MESVSSRRYPSFSSTLLDEIYRSFDDENQPTQPIHTKSRNDCFEDEPCFIHKCMDNVGRRSSEYGVLVKPKPIRTGMDEIVKHRKEDSYATSKHESKFVKTKSKALKIYGDLKKAKHPISPGGRLASFLNSFFTNKKPTTDHLDRKSKSANASTCSSASSFSRSCLSNTPSSRGKLSKRSVTFYPVEEDCHPCGHKSLHQHESNLKKLNLSDKNPHISEAARNLLKKYRNKVECSTRNNEYEDQSEDGGSDSSSDLFELEILSTHMYREELPVYETTRLDTNPLFM